MSLHESNQPKARQTLIFKKSSQEREKLHVDVAVPRRSAWLGGDHARPRPAVRRLPTSRCWNAGAARAVRSPSAVARGEGGREDGREARGRRWPETCGAPAQEAPASATAPSGTGERRPPRVRQSAQWQLVRARAAATGGASKRRGRARRREGEIWAPALAPAARDADALGGKKKRGS